MTNSLTVVQRGSEFCKEFHLQVLVWESRDIKETRGFLVDLVTCIRITGVLLENADSWVQSSFVESESLVTGPMLWKMRDPIGRVGWKGEVSSAFRG